MQFLLDAGKGHTITKDYAGKIQSSGMISATVISSLLRLPEKYDTNVNIIHFLIAVHYITVEYNNLSAETNSKV